MKYQMTVESVSKTTVGTRVSFKTEGKERLYLVLPRGTPDTHEVDDQFTVELLAIAKVPSSQVDQDGKPA